MDMVLFLPVTTQTIRATLPDGLPGLIAALQKEAAKAKEHRIKTCVEITITNDETAPEISAVAR